MGFFHRISGSVREFLVEDVPFQLRELGRATQSFLHSLWQLVIALFLLALVLGIVVYLGYSLWTSKVSFTGTNLFLAILLGVGVWFAMRLRTLDDRLNRIEREMRELKDMKKAP